MCRVIVQDALDYGGANRRMHPGKHGVGIRILRILLVMSNFCSWGRDWPDSCNTIFGQFNERDLMLHWTIVFLVLALIAGLLGFTSLAGTAASIAQVLFVVFLVLLVVSFFSRAMKGKAP
jgi:uncharacterized membrane protein YtjA (UPF0391 family)